MCKFELICLDMFQTLVDVDGRVPFIWKRILGNEYSEQLAKICTELVFTKAINEFHENVNKQKEFLNLKSIFTPCFSEISRDIHIDFNPEEAADIFIDEHGKAVRYEDALQFLKLIGGSIPVCLVSDADEEMIVPLLKIFNFDQVFISESVKSYKNDSQSKIFKEVLKHYKINPEKVIHIGDSLSDIIGANRVGISTCWINRRSKEWEYNIKPDYIVKSLVEVVDIVGLEDGLETPC